MFCKFCGKELEEGELCLCHDAEEVTSEENVTIEANSEEIGITKMEETTVEPQPEGFISFETQPVWQPPVKKKIGLFSRFGSVLRHYISQPIHAIRQAGEFADKGVGFLCCILQAILLSIGMCFYLSAKVQVGYRLGFFEQAVPFGEYLAHSGSSMPLLFLQLAGFFLLSDIILLFLLMLLTGGFGNKNGVSKTIGGIGTALLTSGIFGIIVAVISVILSDVGAIALFGGTVLSLLAIWNGLKSVSDISETKLFYLLPLALVIWFGIISWVISCVPLLSWIFNLL